MLVVWKDQCREVFHLNWGSLSVASYKIHSITVMAVVVASYYCYCHHQSLPSAPA